MESDPKPFCLYGKPISSRLLLGSARYPSPQALFASIRSSETSVVTVSLRRHTGHETGNSFWEGIKSTGVAVLPNTAGCFSAREAVLTARLAREIFKTNWIKLEVLSSEVTLQPDLRGLLSAAETLLADGFEVFPYTTEDASTAYALLQMGCQVVMPWGAPIGSGMGLMNPWALRNLRERFPDATLIVDAGLGAPSHASAAMEMGYDGVLLNTAIAMASNPIAMAQSFAECTRAGRRAWLAGLMPISTCASPSSPMEGRAFV